MKSKIYIVLTGLLLFLSACGQVYERQDKNILSETVEESNVVENSTEQSLNEIKQENQQLEVPAREKVIEEREFCLDGMLDEEEQTEVLDRQKEQIGIETAWQFIKESYFSSSELNEISYDSENKLKIVTYRGEMEFSDGDKKRPCENVIFYDRKEDDDYIFGCYLVFYDENEIFGTKTRGWYSVNSYTGEVTFE